MSSYGDYCPIAIGADVLGDRWTPLIIRELMVGSSGFNEIHRGIPRVSRSLLAQRLRTMERNGLVQRTRSDRGHQGRYQLTPAGEALTPIVWAIGHWAAEWNFGDPTDEECDGLSLLWRLHQHAVPAKLPEQRTVVHVVLTGPGSAVGWLCMEQRGITVCRDDPGYDVDLAVEADTRQMQRWLVGVAPFRDLVAKGDARLLGPSRLARAFPTWFDTSLFAEGLRRADRRRSTHAAAVRRDAVGSAAEALPA
ncbi:winged helix-turn-helix transcriptional regulator [Nakamurella sp. GG22]